MSGLDQFGEELQEEGYHKEADVHAVDIGIGGYDDFVVAESVYAVFDVEGSLQEVEFFVFIDDFLGQTKGVERFSSEREYCL